MEDKLVNRGLIYIRSYGIPSGETWESAISTASGEDIVYRDSPQIQDCEHVEDPRKEAIAGTQVYLITGYIHKKARNDNISEDHRYPSLVVFALGNQGHQSPIPWNDDGSETFLVGTPISDEPLAVVKQYVFLKPRQEEYVLFPYIFSPQIYSWHIQ